MGWNFNDYDQTSYYTPDDGIAGANLDAYDTSLGAAMNQNSGNTNTGNIPWGQLLGAGLNLAGNYFGNSGTTTGGTLSQSTSQALNPFAQNAGQNMQNIANIGSSIAIPGPTGMEANYYNNVLPLLLAQMGGNFMTNQGNLQNIAGQGPQTYLPQNVANMQTLQGQGVNAFYPGQQIEQGQQAIDEIAQRSPQEYLKQFEGQFGAKSNHGGYQKGLADTYNDMRLKLAGQQQQQSAMAAQMMQNAQQQVPQLMNQISGLQQNANQFAPKTQMAAMAQQTQSNQLLPYLGQLFGQGTNTYLDRLKQASNLYNPLLSTGVQGSPQNIARTTEQTATNENPWWINPAIQAGSSLLTAKDSSGTSGWGNILSGLGNLGTTIGGWFS